ncbi:MAG TPA: 5-dehydro-2-deoxygluconokinase [Vicinamibacterales bacterium]|jgi:5-dehydro-2-deoxygluconokinase|nr:5-dehydro-2-deoxygluconokinase [Vicinamibacterales bacterium]
MSRQYDVLTMGRSSIDLYAHQIGVPMTEVTSFDAYVGGCPTNIAVGTRRLGLRSALLTAVGADEVGDFILNFLNRETIETRFIPRKPGRRTSAVLMSIQPPDKFPLTFYRDNCADRELTIDDVDRAPIADAALVVVTGTGLSHEPSRSATMHAAARANSASTTVLVDIDYRPDQWPDRPTFASNVQALLRQADFAIGTEEELSAAVDGAMRGDDAAAAVLALGPKALILKRGGAGATVYTPGEAPAARARRRGPQRGSRVGVARRREAPRSGAAERERAGVGPREHKKSKPACIDVPPFPVEVLNVLGAGDAFASGFIYGLRQGWSLERSARVGNATGAIIVTRHGCANFMPTWAEVQAFVAERGGRL